MIYWHIFIAFFIPGILGYGGGPASIPLVEHEVVEKYKWLTTEEFSEIVALGNSLPGPIATKMAGYIGYVEGGILGSIVAVLATVGPSLLLMILLLSFIYKYKDSPEVKNITKIVKPIIAVLLGVMTLEFMHSSIVQMGIFTTIIFIVVSYYLLEIKKVHPAIVIVLALVSGSIMQTII